MTHIDEMHITRNEPDEESLTSARQLIVAATLAGADAQLIEIRNATLHDIPLGDWTVTVSRIERES